MSSRGAPSFGGAGSATRPPRTSKRRERRALLAPSPSLRTGPLSSGTMLRLLAALLFVAPLQAQPVAPARLNASSSVPQRAAGRAAERMPYAAAGLTAEQAAAHLLSRFAYGARPGEVGPRRPRPGRGAGSRRSSPAQPPDARPGRRLASLRCPRLLDAETVARTYPPQRPACWPRRVAAGASSVADSGRVADVYRSEAFRAFG